MNSEITSTQFDKQIKSEIIQASKNLNYGINNTSIISQKFDQKKYDVTFKN